MPFYHFNNIDDYEAQLDFEDSLSRYSERQHYRNRIEDLEGELVTDPENADIINRIENYKTLINES